MADNELFGNSEQLDNISRAEAINAICEDGTRLERQGRYSMTMVERKQRDADILDALPSAQQWIPCSERLPERNGYYLVTGRQGAVNKRLYQDGYWYGNWTVLAWMPLPTPYRPEGEEHERID